MLLVFCFFFWSKADAGARISYTSASQSQEISTTVHIGSCLKGGSYGGHLLLSRAVTQAKPALPSTFSKQDLYLGSFQVCFKATVDQPVRGERERDGWIEKS